MVANSSVVNDCGRQFKFPAQPDLNSLVGTLLVIAWMPMLPVPSWHYTWNSS